MKIILLWSIFRRSHSARFTGFKVSTNIFFLKFFLAIVFHLTTKKKRGQSRHISRKLSSISPYLDHITCCQNIVGFQKKILLSSRERPNDLWIGLLVNDLPVHLPHKIGKKKTPRGIRTGYLGFFLANQLCYLGGLIDQFGYILLWTIAIPTSQN
jgi:hypothetical protein